MEKIKLSQIEAPVTAVEAGSFSAASVELGCTQSRISHSIAELERHLGVRLLERARAGCAPTRAGQRVLAREIGHESRYRLETSRARWATPELDATALRSMRDS